MERNKRTLRQIRKEKDMTFNKLEELSGISRQAIMSIESGACSPKISTMFALCRALGVSIDDVDLSLYA